MIDKLAVGKAGEAFACEYLLEQGMTVLERNFRMGKGEIDIIARDRGDLVFVEVKTRSSTQYGSAAEAVTFHKRRMVAKTAQYYILQNHLEQLNVRFDVAEVYRDRSGMRINYITNAFCAWE